MVGVNESTVRYIRKNQTSIRDSIAASAPACAKVAHTVRDKCIVKMEKELNI
jgi:hypothetical protein